MENNHARFEKSLDFIMYLTLIVNIAAAILTLFIAFLGSPMGSHGLQSLYNFSLTIFDILVILAPLSMFAYIIIKEVNKYSLTSQDSLNNSHFNSLYTSTLIALILLLFFANFVPFYGESNVFISQIHRISPFLIPFIIFLIPVFIIIYDLRSIKFKKSNGTNIVKPNSEKQAGKFEIIRMIFLIALIVVGFYLSLPIIFRPGYGVLAWIGVFSASIGFLLFFVFLSISVSLFRILARNLQRLRITKLNSSSSSSPTNATGSVRVTKPSHRSHPSYKRTKVITYTSSISIIFGVIVSIIFISPVFYLPEAVQRSNHDFSIVFGDPKTVGAVSLDEGSSNSNNLDHHMVVDYFLKEPYHISSSFINYQIPEVTIKENILYFNGTLSSYEVDRNITLYFDAFLPKGTPEEINKLPGRNSTIIRIHGGGWAIGDKGMMNVGDMNRYLAAQGYIVFDIQYGLTNNRWHADALTPDNVVGNFTIDDMMRHIGNFTFYLEKHYTEFGANLSSVFVSGGSAGGQLTCATALAMHSGNYTNIFSDKLVIRGLIPYYPANFIYDYVYIPGAPEFLNPELLIDSTAPPCLIFQGLHDGMVNPEVSASFMEKYKEKDGECVVIWLPKAGHAADLYFPGYYNMLFLYYMERFLYLTR